MSAKAMQRTNPAWIHLWFLFLQLNKDYAAYCKAKRKKQANQCSKLKKQFPKIAEVYEDFGTVYGIKFDDWYNTHKHLFYVKEQKVRTFNKLPKKLDPKSIHLRIPLEIQVSKATKQAATLIRAAYQKATEDQKRPTEVAKYSLATKVPSYVSWMSTFKCFVAIRYSEPIDGKKPSQKVIVEKMIEVAERWADEYWDWSEQSLELRGGFVEEIRASTSRHIKHARHIVANTIYGKFPVKTSPK